jgi:hypothetical protein
LMLKNICENEQAWPTAWCCKETVLVRQIWTNPPDPDTLSLD